MDKDYIPAPAGWPDLPRFYQAAITEDFSTSANLLGVLYPRLLWGPFAIVLTPPHGDFSSGVSQGGEPIRIQTFIPQSPIEALHVTVGQH